MTLHKEGTTIITSAFAATLLLLGGLHFLLPEKTVLFWSMSAVAGTFLILILQFFRSPHRTLLQDDHLVYSPADGKVVAIEEVEETEYFNDRRIQVSIFMSPLNVHINWLPISGIVKYTKYHPGLFLVAWHPKSSTENERTTIVVERENKSAVLMRQIAGAVARRIVYYSKEGEKAEQGSQFGFIKFGSRVDLLLPLDTEINVSIDQKVTGKNSVIATFKD